MPLASLDKFFSAKSIAVIGVSRDPRKVGHVIFRNFVDAKFGGKVFPVNPNAEEILGHKAYRSVDSIREKIDLAIISVPAELTPSVINECGKKKIKNVIIITSGFKEAGDNRLDNALSDALRHNKIRAIGPNCLGCYDAYTRLDSLFLPRYRMQRPKEGSISFICQSGAVGSSILDMAAEEGFGFSKFVSYGNAMNVDESDLLEYMGRDRRTKVICMYVEGLSDGRKFMKAAYAVGRKKPVVIIKGGKTEEGKKATMSHTGSLAGSAEVYSGIFKQCGLIEVETLEEMFEAAKVLEKCQRPKGRRVAVITNGGGYGILATDAIVKHGLEMAKISGESVWQMKKLLPGIAAHNPMDLLGDATTERYKTALDIMMKDENSDIILLIVLYQTPLVTTDIVDAIIDSNDMRKKPIIVVSAGGEFTEVLSKNLERNGVPHFDFPENAVRAISRLAGYYGK